MGAKIVLRNIERRNFYLAQTLSRTQCIVTRFVSSISNISTTLLKTVENKRHYSEEPRSGANWLRYRSKRSPRKDRATVNYVHV